MEYKITVGDYLIRRLVQVGLRHIFGVPGDYVLDFMDKIVASPIDYVGTCNELNAGYAADGYARVNGIGAVVVTFGVGGLSLVNAVSGAWAERVPLLVISGAPHSMHRLRNIMMHHVSSGFKLQLEVFERITVASAILTDPVTAPAQIDRVLAACLKYKRPAYIEIPADMVNELCHLTVDTALQTSHESDPGALAESVEEAAALLNAAERPALLLGLEVHRFGMQSQVRELLERTGYPFAPDINGKGILSERHPGYTGIYMGILSSGTARETIESSDGLLCLGAWKTDIATASFSAQISARTSVHAVADRVKISNHFYDRVFIGDFISHLIDRLNRSQSYFLPDTQIHCVSEKSHESGPQDPITVRRLVNRLNDFITEEMIVVADTGDSLFAGASLLLPHENSFLAQAYYVSIGYALPATLGVALAAPSKRPLLLIGDGAFQMTAQCFSTIVKQRTRPIVVLLNNDGYAIERLIHDGPYNDIQPWQYHRLPEFFGGGIGFLVQTEGDLDTALDQAAAHQNVPILIETKLQRNDCTETLARVAQLSRKLSVDGGT